jgi:GTPase SAR1 family protein
MTKKNYFKILDMATQSKYQSILKDYYTGGMGIVMYMV